jgi:very-short-patch-repair endonuclease
MPDQLDARPDRLIAALAAKDWGVLSVEELRRCGLSPDAIGWRERCGHLHRLHRGVYAVGHPGVGELGRFLAAVKACGPAAVLSHRSAAVLWEFLPGHGGAPEVTVVGAGTRARPGIRVRRTAALERHEIVLFQRIPATSPVRTLIDLASVVEEKRLRRAVREAQAVRRVSVHRLLAELRRLGPRRGSRKLERIIATGPAPTRSELEDEVLGLILRGGLAHPDVNAPLLIGGMRVEPDFRWPEARLVVEADGARWHGTPLAQQNDAERQALLEAYGERVIRVTWAQALTRPAVTLARLRAAGAPSAARASS